MPYGIQVVNGNNVVVFDTDGLQRVMTLVASYSSTLQTDYTIPFVAGSQPQNQISSGSVVVQTGAITVPSKADYFVTMNAVLENITAATPEHFALWDSVHGPITPIAGNNFTRDVGELGTTFGYRNVSIVTDDPFTGPASGVTFGLIAYTDHNAGGDTLRIYQIVINVFLMGH